MSGSVPIRALCLVGGSSRRNVARASGNQRILEAGEAEVEQLRAGTRQHDVRRLDVAVHHAGGMSGRERVGELDRDGQPLIERERATREACGERLAIHQLHDEVLDGDTAERRHPTS